MILFILNAVTAIPESFSPRNSLLWKIDFFQDPVFHVQCDFNVLYIF